MMKWMKGVERWRSARKARKSNGWEEIRQCGEVRSGEEREKEK